MKIEIKNKTFEMGDIIVLDAENVYSVYDITASRMTLCGVVSGDLMSLTHLRLKNMMFQGRVRFLSPKRSDDNEMAVDNYIRETLLVVAALLEREDFADAAVFCSRMQQVRSFPQSATSQKHMTESLTDLTYGAVRDDSKRDAK